ncbi:MarR family transcriptional regulator [Brevibacterium sp. JNUCC-42]|nr:MarR family transcriptional regulator [Brevibacterium sp. JNUCC-42]
MNNKKMLALDQQLCFSIYACSREICRLYRPHLEEMGLTYPQYLVLLILWDKHSCTVKQLGQLLYLDSGTLTPMLKRLEAMGLVKRERSTTDERTVNVTITDKGKELQGRADGIKNALVESTAISMEEFGSLLVQMQAMLERIHDLNQNKTYCCIEADKE